MEGSAVPTPDRCRAPDSLRASDAERDEVAARLRDEFAAGRLSHETFLQRMDVVLEAKRRGDLSQLVADLPAGPGRGRPPAGPAPAGPAPGVLAGRLRGALHRLLRLPGPLPGGPLPGRPASGGPVPVGPVPAGPVPAGPAPGGAPARRRTIGMLAAGGGQPLPLRFPRGTGDQFSIGRDVSCDLAIADMTVSRRHATLERTADGWLLSDLGSTNGTRINGWRVRGKVRVIAGDLVSFGNAEAVFARPDDPGELIALPARWRVPGHVPRRVRVNGGHVLGSDGVTTVLLIRHGLTATTGQVLTGWTPGVGLDERGRAQARSLGTRLASVSLDAIVTSPLDRCRQTVAEFVAAWAAGVPDSAPAVDPVIDDRVGECRYGDWTGRPLQELQADPLWPVVQAHPSAVRFPGPDGESMPDMQHRAVSAIRDWNARLGADATYLVCSHGDVIKAIVADSLGLHLDQCQRIVADPCSLTVIRYTPLRPFVLRLNDTGDGVAALLAPPERQGGTEGASSASDAVIGGGAGSNAVVAQGDSAARLAAVAAADRAGSAQAGTHAAQQASAVQGAEG